MEVYKIHDDEEKKELLELLAKIDVDDVTILPPDEPKKDKDLMVGSMIAKEEILYRFVKAADKRSDGEGILFTKDIKRIFGWEDEDE